MGIGPDGGAAAGGAEPGGMGGDGPGAGTASPAGGMSSADRAAVAVLLSVHGLGPITLGRLVERLGSPAAIIAAAAATDAPDAARRLIQASRAPGGEWPAMPLALAEAIVLAARRRDAILLEVERHGLRVVARDDPDYPKRLRAIEVPPPALFVRGSLDSLASEHVVAVVGTRRPSPLGRRIASRIAAALARAEATVVSGLAIGIDGAAHAAAIAEERPTVAFIGGGHGRLFPKPHDRLADAIVERGGAVISEYAPMVEPTRGTFPQRNRLISGASDAVVVVEAGASSGALITASWALEQGRECFVVPGSIDSPASAGCNGFLREWAGAARVVSGIPQLLDDLDLFGGAAIGLAPPGGTPAGGPARTTPTPVGPERSASPGGVVIKATVPLPSARASLAGRSPQEQDVGEALVHGAVTVDELVAVTRRSLAEVLRALTRLEAAGLVHARHGRYEPLGALAAANPGRPRAA